MLTEIYYQHHRLQVRAELLKFTITKHREGYIIGAASYFNISILFRLNFVTVVDLCFKKFW